MNEPPFSFSLYTRMSFYKFEGGPYIDVNEPFCGPFDQVDAGYFFLLYQSLINQAQCV